MLKCGSNAVRMTWLALKWVWTSFRTRSNVVSCCWIFFHWGVALSASNVVSFFKVLHVMLPREKGAKVKTRVHRLGTSAAAQEIPKEQDYLNTAIEIAKLCSFSYLLRKPWCHCSYTLDICITFIVFKLHFIWFLLNINMCNCGFEIAHFWRQKAILFMIVSVTHF